MDNAMLYILAGLVLNAVANALPRRVARNSDELWCKYSHNEYMKRYATYRMGIYINRRD